MDLGQWVVIGLSVVMGLWYIVGATINRKRGVATFHWLREGLEALGKVSEARWIGSSGSGARLVVGNPSSPFRRVEVVFLLDSREILPLWLFNLLRGKQDEMILKASLRKGPPLVMEAHRPRRRKPDVTQEGAADPQGFTFTRKGKGGEAWETCLRRFLQRYGQAVHQISLQRKSPHLILRAQLPSLRSEGEGKAFFRDLQQCMRGGQ